MRLEDLAERGKKREIKTVKVNVPFNEAYQISLRICVK